MVTTTEMKASLEDAKHAALHTASTLASSQWDILHGSNSVPENAAAESFIDPEALLLMSLQLQQADTRFSEEIAWFCEENSHLINYYRLNQLSWRYPLGIRVQLSACIHLDRKSIQHTYPFSKSLLSSDTLISNINSAPVLSAKQALILRLRSGFGASAETDILGCIIGNNNELDGDRISQLTGYPEEALQRRLDLMILSKFIKRNAKGFTDTYRANTAFTSSLLKSQADHPKWLNWMHIYSFLSHTIHFSSKDIDGETKLFALSKEAGRIIEDHNTMLTNLGIETEPPFSGTAYFDTYNQTVQRLAYLLTKSP